MGLTNDLRKLISREMGRTPGSYYYLKSDKDATYPYKVAEISPVVYVEGGRYDSTLTVDIYDRRNLEDRTEIEDLADSVQDSLNNAHYAEQDILATFWLETRQNVPDPDVGLQRIRLTFLCQAYKRGEVNGN